LDKTAAHHGVRGVWPNNTVEENDMSKMQVLSVIQEPRDFAETGRMSALLGIGSWIFFAVAVSALFAAFQDRSFGDVFPMALKWGVFFGALVAVVVAFTSGPVRATIKFLEKNDFVTHLNMATSQLGYSAAANTGDLMTFKPSIQTGGVFAGLVSLQLQDDQAAIFGAKFHVMKILKRMETV
jgi:hypothetical protein